MKALLLRQTRNLSGISQALMFALAGTLTCHAADGTWINLLGGNWSDAASWSAGSIADGPGSTANFSTLDLTSPPTVTLDSARTNANLIFGDTDLNSAIGWFISNGGVAANAITLSNSAATPVITVNAINGPNGIDPTNDVIFGAVLTGGQGFIKRGAGTLTLTNANNFDASVQLEAGVVTIANAAALGSGNRAVIFNGGAVRVAPFVAAGNPAFANTNIVQTVGSLISSNGNYDAYNGPFIGSGTMLIHSTGRLTLGGGSATTFAGFTGTLDLTDSTAANETRINLGGGSVYDLSATTLNTGTNGGRFDFRTTVAPATVRIGALLGGPGTRLDSSEQAAGTSLTWEVGHLNTSSTFNGTIRNRNGAADRVGHLTKVGTGTLTLTGTNTYTGNTVISNGVLALSGGGSLAGTPVITILSGARLDVSGLLNPWSLGTTQTLANGGVITGAVSIASGLINPAGAGVGTANFSGNLSLAEGVTNHFDLTSPGTGDSILVTGDLSLTSAGGGIVVQVRPTGAVIPSGTYTLFKWSGNLVGGGLLLDAPTQTGTLTLGTNLAAREIFLQVTGVAGAANLVWRGDGAVNNWDLATLNWRNGGTASAFASGDNVTFDNTGSNNVPVNLTTALSPASVVVNAIKDYVFGTTGSGKISGAGGLLKTNTGKLTLAADNDYVGATVVAGGILQIGDGLNPLGTLGTGTVTNNGVLSYNRPDTIANSGPIYGTGTVVQASVGGLTMNGVNGYSGNTVVSNGTLTIGAATSIGSGPLVLAGGTVNAGALAIANPLRVVADSTINNTAGELQFTSDSITGTGGTLTLSGTLARFAGTGFTFNQPIILGLTALQSYNANGTQTFSGVISGTGQYRRRWPDSTPSNTGATIFSAQNTYSGGTLLREGSIGFGSSSVSTFPPTIDSGPIGVGTLNQDNATYTAVFASGGPRTVGNDVVLNGAGQALIIKGGFGLTFSGAINLGGASKTIQVDNTAGTILSGTVSSGDLVKTGSGVLYFNGTNDASSTTISAGVLGGNGVFAGPVTNSAGGTLAPGTSIGTMTISSALVLAAGSTTVMELNATTGASDKVQGLTNVIYGGVLQLTNLAGTLTNGASFRLFDSTSYSGSFASISPATPGSGQTWNTNNLAVNGTISVSGSASQQPVISDVTRLANGNFQFTFTGVSGQAYRVWAATNVTLSPVTSTWTLLTNSTFGSGPAVYTDTQTGSFPLRFYVITTP